MITRLALGTAQFGGAYGIANRSGEVSDRELRLILDTATAAGIKTCDTAVSYGRAEERLGAADLAGWNVVTKLPGLPEDVGDVHAWVQSAIEASLRRLGRSSVWGLLLHRSADLRGPHAEALRRALSSARAQGLTTKIGVSVYGPAELDAVWSADFDIVQAPFNVLDQRLLTSGWLERFATDRVEVHARSVFLQGVLLVPAGERRPYFDRWASMFERWTDWLTQHHADPIKVCLDFVLSHDAVTYAVVGVDSREQLQQLIHAAAAPRLSALACGFASDDIALIEPFRWKAQ